MRSVSLMGLGCGMAAGALWGFALLAPALIKPFGPIALTACRFASYGVFSLLLVLPRWRKIMPLVSTRQWQALFILSILGNILYYTLLGAAIQLCGIAMPALIVGFLPVTVTIIGAFEHGAVPLKRLAPSIALSTAGMGCIAWQAFHIARHNPEKHGIVALVIGLVCAVGALLSWSAYAVKNARCLKQLEHLSNHEWNLLTGLVTGGLALLLFPFAFGLTEPCPDYGWARFILIASAVALLASILGNAFWNKMCRLLPLTMVGQMILFETLFSLLYGFLWEKRLPSPAETGAIILVTSSVITCMHAHRPVATD